MDQDLRMVGGEGGCAGDDVHHSEVEVFLLPYVPRKTNKK